MHGGFDDLLKEAWDSAMQHKIHECKLENIEIKAQEDAESRRAWNAALHAAPATWTFKEKNTECSQQHTSLGSNTQLTSTEG